MKKYIILFIASIALSCSKDEVVKSSEKLIISLSFGQLSPAVTATIDQSTKTITATLPYGTDLTKLTPTFVVSSKAVISPASGISQDFTKPFTFTVTAEDGSKSDYKVSVSKAQPNFIGEWDVSMKFNNTPVELVTSSTWKFTSDSSIVFSRSSIGSKDRNIYLTLYGKKYSYKSYESVIKGNSLLKLYMDNKDVNMSNTPFLLDIGYLELGYYSDDKSFTMYGYDKATSILAIKSMDTKTLVLYPIDKQLEIILTKK